jgi:hypothetical protein
MYGEDSDYVPPEAISQEELKALLTDSEASSCDEEAEDDSVSIIVNESVMG